MHLSQQVKVPRLCEKYFQVSVLVTQSEERLTSVSEWLCVHAFKDSDINVG